MAFPTAPAPAALAVGDLDDDGFADVVVSHLDLDQISVLLANGVGGLVELGRFDAGDEAFSLLVADVNRDGVEDVISTGLRGTLDFSLGQRVGGFGTGTLSPRVSYLVGSGPNHQAPLDVNADGLLDLVVVNGTSSDLSVLLANPTHQQLGPATLRRGSEATLPAGFTAAVIADLDRDGALDLVASSALDDLVVVAGEGEGGVPHGRWGVSRVVGAATAATDVVVCDLDGDRRPDVALATAAGVAVLLARDDEGQLGPATLIPLAAPPTRLAAVAPAAGGPCELVAAPAGVPEVVNVAYAPGGTLATATVPVAGPVSDLAVCDVDADSISDLMLLHESVDQVSVLLGESGGGWTVGGSAAIASDAGAVRCMDLNGDGRGDAAVTGGAGLQVYPGGPGGALAGPLGTSIPGGAVGSAFVDLNGDGAWDLLSLGPAQLRGALGELSGGVPTGRFGPSETLHTGADGAELLGGDIDGDAVGDVVLLTGGAAPGADVLLGQLEDFRTAWEQPSRPWDDPLPAAVRWLGQVFPTEPDRFGTVPPAAYLNQHRARVGEVPCPPGTTPLSGAWSFGSELRLTRVQRGGRTRLRVEERFGARAEPGTPDDFDRAGLDLAASPPRGLAVELPIPAAHALPAPSEVQVVVGSPIWLRASEVPADPIAAELDAGRYLPQTQAGRDIVDVRTAWRVVEADPDADLTTGTTERALLVASERLVRVLVERLGTLQACAP